MGLLWLSPVNGKSSHRHLKKPIAVYMKHVSFLSVVSYIGQAYGSEPFAFYGGGGGGGGGGVGGGGGGRKIFQKHPGPNFQEKISRTGKILLYAL